MCIRDRLAEEEYRREEDYRRPARLSLLLGGSNGIYGIYDAEETTGRVADLNVFSSSLSVEKMKRLTSAGEEECGEAGDLISWEEAEWTLQSMAQMNKVNREWQGPCRKESKIYVFSSLDETFEKHHDCMHHCTMRK